MRLCQNWDSDADMGISRVDEGLDGIIGKISGRDRSGSNLEQEFEDQRKPQISL